MSTDIFNTSPDDQPDVSQAAEEDKGLTTESAAGSIIESAKNTEYDEDLPETVVELDLEDIGKGNVHLFVPFLLGDSLDEDSQRFRDAYEEYLNGSLGQTTALAGEEGFKDGMEAAFDVQNSYRESEDKTLIYGFVSLLEDREQFNKPLRFQSIDDYLDDLLERKGYAQSDLQAPFSECANAISEAYSNCFINGVAYTLGVKTNKDGEFVFTAEDKEAADRIRKEVDERREERQVQRVKAARKDYTVPEENIEEQFDPSLSQDEADEKSAEREDAEQED